jgi:hypothetical protein
MRHTTCLEAATSWLLEIFKQAPLEPVLYTAVLRISPKNTRVTDNHLVSGPTGD